MRRHHDINQELEVDMPDMLNAEEHARLAEEFCKERIKRLKFLKQNRATLERLPNINPQVLYELEGQLQQRIGPHELTDEEMTSVVVGTGKFDRFPVRNFYLDSLNRDVFVRVVRELANKYQLTIIDSNCNELIPEYQLVLALGYNPSRSTPSRIHRFMKLDSDVALMTRVLEFLIPPRRFLFSRYEDYVAELTW